MIVSFDLPHSTWSLLEMLNGKPLNWLPTGNWFSERVTGYRIYCMSHGQDPGNADSGV